jgi:hypothetical protein
VIDTKTSGRFAGLVALAAVTGTLAVGAQATDDGPAASHYTPQAFSALMIRSKALNCLHIRAQDCLTSAELRALLIRSQELNRLHGKS